MLFSMFSVGSAGVPSSDAHFPACGVGTMATTGASMPARFSRMSSGSVDPRRQIRHAPIAISEPTKIA